jgi:hypothetical protein
VPSGESWRNRVNTLAYAQAADKKLDELSHDAAKYKKSNGGRVIPPWASKGIIMTPVTAFQSTRIIEKADSFGQSAHPFKLPWRMVVISKDEDGLPKIAGTS